MDGLMQVVWLFLGFVMLIKGADWFVDGAAGFARRLRIPQLVIGLTIVAMGTSAPEAAVSIIRPEGKCRNRSGKYCRQQYSEYPDYFRFDFSVYTLTCGGVHKKL